MNGHMTFQPSISAKKMTSMEVDVAWDALEFHPTQNQKKKGGVYVAYTLGMKDGPGGYFGVQIKASSGDYADKLFKLRLTSNIFFTLLRTVFLRVPQRFGRNSGNRISGISPLQCSS